MTEQQGNLERAAEIFERASQLQGEGRERYLEGACGGDASLRADIDSMMAAHAEQGEFLASPTQGNGEPDGQRTETRGSEQPGERAGSTIGRYKLLQRIGEGGFGVVYMAEQTEPVKRRVALKIIKLGMDTKQVIARFEAERQALALMEHPNIAKVFDAGATETGRPYFVMELVKGIPITEYCDKNNLSTKERLDLFKPVCNAIQHAHQKGIIHRDIKPSNVMVTLHDGKPVPKVIDFGIAKATDHRLTEKTLFTEYHQLIGTPAYMSPEQAEMSGLDVDTRTDIYSLGVLLYELLTGTTPFEAKLLREAAYGEIQRIIREVEPPKPSTRLSTLGERLTDIAKHRRAEPKTLSKLVRGDLDWIVMKALEKDRTRRYETASDLARDIQHHLDDKPVQAGPPSAVYRLRKFARRYKGPVAAGTAFILLLLAFGATASIQAHRNMRLAEREREARSEAVAARDRAIAASEEAARARESAEERAETLRRKIYANQIALAQGAFDALEIGRMKEVLGQCPADLRHWEWHRLKRLSDQSILTLRGHEGTVASVAFSPDGTRAVSGSGDKTLKVWDARTGEAILTLRGHDDSVCTVAFSPDGRRIASGASDGAVMVWDSATGQEMLSLRGHEWLVYSVAFSPDGKQIASGGVGALLVWDAITGKAIQSLGQGGTVHSVAFSRDGTQIVSGNSRGSPTRPGFTRLAPVGRDLIVVWDAQTSEPALAWGGRGRAEQVTFSPDSAHIIGMDYSGVTIWNVATQEEILKIPREAVASCFAVSPNGEWIVTGGWEKSLKLWDTDRGRLALTLHGHKREINTVAFSPDGQRLISGSSDGSVKLWDLSACDTTPVLLERDHCVRSVMFNPDGTSILSASTGRSVFRSITPGNVEQCLIQDHACGLALTEWDTATGVRRRSLSDSLARGELQTPSGYLMTSCAFSRDGARFAAGAWYEPQATSALSKPYWPVTVWEMADESKIKGLTEHQKTVWAVAFSPDGRQIASASAPNTLLLSDAITGAKLLTPHKPAGNVTVIRFTPDGRKLVVGTSQGIVELLDSATGELSLEVRAHTGGFVTVTAIAVSPDGKHIASGGSDGTVTLWATASGQGIQTQREHESEVTCLAYSPDGKRLVSGSDDATLRIWNTETGEAMLVLRAHTSRVTCVAFSPDGAQIVSGSREEALRLWTAVGAPMHPLRGIGHTP